MTQTPQPSDTTRPVLDHLALDQQVKQALQMDADAVAEQVRSITLKALQGTGLDREAMQSVMNTILSSAQPGPNASQAQAAHALKEAVRGLDEALATAAQATQLSIREAMGRGQAFSEETLKRATQELAALEGQFIDTLKQTAQHSAGHVQTTLRDLAQHASTQGTAVGKMVQAALAPLGQAMVDSARAQMQTGTDILRKEATLFAHMAAGLLEGLAQQLRSAAPKDSSKDEAPKA